jgi:hypothetical protein
VASTRAWRPGGVVTAALLNLFRQLESWKSIQLIGAGICRVKN